MEDNGIGNIDGSDLATAKAQNERTFTLPPELWELIAWHLRYKDLVKLLGLNRVFLKIVLDRRYQEFKLLDSGRRFVEKLEKISNEEIASRIQVLTLSPRDTWDAISYVPPSRRQDVVKKEQPGFIKTIVNYLLSSEAEAAPTSTAVVETPSPIPPRQMVIRGAQALVNLRDLRLVWRSKEDGYVPEYRHPLCPFLETVLLNFGHNISSLTLTIPSSVARTYTPPAKYLERLEELDIKFDADEYRDRNVNLTALLPLINGTSHTVKSFSLEALGGLSDVSLFFLGLVSFPFLIKLSLTMPLSPILLSDPSGLNRLLKHPIVDLEIRYKYGSIIVPSISDLETAQWWNQCTQGVSFNTLRKLQLGATDSMPPALRRHILSLPPPSQQLTSLAIIDFFLEHHQVTQVLTAFNGRDLIDVSLFVATLCIELIDDLADACPRMERLCLTYRTLRESPNGLACNIATFSNLIKNATRRSQWGLRDIDVWVLLRFHSPSYHTKRKRHYEAMHNIVSYVPAITSFAGQGHMDEEML
ncbi:hypothetical protein H0H92_010169 [Tricholoma furcatifolium]|nr:hypothetical protein H0H92_010169 [Tricholoma furcatifolium]